jgi:hypothetical protein
VKEVVAAWKRRSAEVFVPLAHPPGEAQVDFGQAEVVVDGQATTVALFVMTLPYSDAVFVRAFPRECTEAFLEGHVRAFAFFGGVPRRISCWSPPHTLALCWDRPWRAYVALVFDYSRKPPQEDWVILRIGCKPPHDRYPDLDDMVRALNAALADKLPAVTLSPAKRQRLLDDRRLHFDDLRRRGIDPLEPLDFSKDDEDDEEEELGPSMAYPTIYVLRSADYGGRVALE